MSDPSPTAILAAPVAGPSRPESLRHPRYHIVLLDDNDHTYEYVIEMFTKLFAVRKEDALLMAVEVDTHGRVICDTTSFERAEFKRDQVHAFGADWRIEACRGSMTAILEAAPC